MTSDFLDKYEWEGFIKKEEIGFDQVVKHVLGADFSQLVRRFDRMRQKRNRFTYDEPALLVSQTETKDAFLLATEFVKRVSEFIQEKNPQQKLV